MSSLSLLLDVPLEISKGFDFAIELTKQLLTLSIGMLGISITFAKDIFKKVSKSVRYIVSISWVLYFFSIIFGILHIMALTGELTNNSNSNSIKVPESARFYATYEIICFGFATLFIVIYGLIGLHKNVAE